MIRTVQERDASCLAAVSIEVFMNTYLREDVEPLFADYVLSEFTAQKFRDAIDDPAIVIWVSEHGAGIDGFVTVCSSATPPVAGCSPLEIRTLYVRSRQQSGGRGIALLQRALEHCRAIEGEKVWLKVSVENDRTIAFYLRHGFHKIGSTLFRVGDQAYGNDVMKLEFGPGSGSPSP